MESLKELSERARVCTNKEWRAELKDCHIKLDKAIDAFWRNPNVENLREVNSLWAKAHKVFVTCPPDADPLPPLSGAPVAPILAAMAA